jgi:hypothetical protein
LLGVEGTYVDFWKADLLGFGLAFPLGELLNGALVQLRRPLEISGTGASGYVHSKVDLNQSVTEISAAFHEEVNQTSGKSTVVIGFVDTLF